MRLALLALLAALLWLVAPYWLQQGMFMDGQIYAAVAQNLLDEANDRYGCPEIINSDQGSQYTSHAWTSFLEKKDIKISMGGKGRATDNAWIERFWRTIKKTYLYLNPAETGTELYQHVEHYNTYYNNRFHQANKTKPNVLYYQHAPTLALAS